MPSLETLDPRAIKVIAAATETVYGFREYLPGRVLLAMVWSFRNDVRSQARAPRESYPGQPVPLELRTLDAYEFDALADAVAVMLEDRFTAVMEDPELPARLNTFDVKLKAERGERDAAAETAELEVPAPRASSR
jgi:hypothetical protein